MFYLATQVGIGLYYLLHLPKLVNQCNVRWQILFWEGQMPQYPKYLAVASLVFVWLIKPSLCVSIVHCRTKISSWSIKVMTRVKLALKTLTFFFLETDSQNLPMTNGHFKTPSGHFFVTYMKIIHKTYVQTIILKS